MLQFGTTPTSEVLYLIANQASNAIKAIVHMVNTKLRKLKKNMPETSTKLDKLSKTLRASARRVRGGRSCRCTASGSRTKKSFVEIKLLPFPVLI